MIKWFICVSENKVISPFKKKTTSYSMRNEWQNLMPITGATWLRANITIGKCIWLYYCSAYMQNMCSKLFTLLEVRWSRYRNMDLKQIMQWVQKLKHCTQLRLIISCMSNMRMLDTKASYLHLPPPTHTYFEWEAYLDDTQVCTCTKGKLLHHISPSLWSKSQ